MFWSAVLCTAMWKALCADVFKAQSASNKTAQSAVLHIQIVAILIHANSAFRANGIVREIGEEPVHGQQHKKPHRFATLTLK